MSTIIAAHAGVGAISASPHKRLANAATRSRETWGSGKEVGKRKRRRRGKEKEKGDIKKRREERVVKYNKELGLQRLRFGMHPSQSHLSSTQ